MASFRPGLLYLLVNGPRYGLNRRLGASNISLDVLKRK
jgi:hypothetical protein